MLKKLEKLIWQQEMQSNNLEEQVEEVRRSKQDSEKKKKKKKKKKEKDDGQPSQDPIFRMEEKLKKELERHKKIASKLAEHKER